MGEYEKALETYNQILDHIKTEKATYEGDETAARALASIGQTYMKMGDLEKASDYLKQAMELYPDDETLAFNIGEIYFQQQQVDMAIEYYNKAAQINDTWAPPFRQLGYAYLNTGDYQGAVDAFKKFLEVAPDDPLAPTIENLIPQLEAMIKK
jgi:tetratricopeptide (TPR) repeat protein